MKGGFGVGLAGKELLACALAVVNAVGHVRGEDGAIIASARGEDGALVDSDLRAMLGAAPGRPAENTTISVVALNRSFSKTDLYRIARSASAAHARRIGPSGTSYDGDVVFAVCPADAAPGQLLPAESAATAALEQAIVRAVRTARGRDGIPGLAG
jgi:L-aminopeptidase/D-esterase-like protein